MPKKRNKVARWLVSVNEPQKKMLDEMMQDDAQTDVSTFFGNILVEVYKVRQEYKNKKPVGRPRKIEDEEGENNYDNDLPKNIPYFNQMIGPKEYADKMEIQGQFRSKG